MSPAIKRTLPLALVVAASVWIAFTGLTLRDYPADIGPGDYPFDAAPAIEALARWDVPAFLDARPVMGPLSVAVRAPFAAVAEPGQLAEYRWGSLPCVLAAGLLGLYLAGIARRRGCAPASQVAIVLLCLFNPLTFSALETGHPEEILTAALAVAAVAVASQGHSARAGLLLGLALASKQWAVIAVMPMLMAMPQARVRASLVAVAVALALYLPGALADPSQFISSQGNAASTHAFVGEWSVWYPIAGSVPSTGTAGPGGLTAPIDGGSELIGALSHPFIVLLALAVPLGLALRRGRFGLSGADAMALLAFLALLRSALDPVDNAYYHLPLLLALVGWDAHAERGVPWRGLLGAGVMLVLWRLWPADLDPGVFNAVYIAFALTAAFALGRSLMHPGGRAPASSLAVTAPRPARAG